MRIQAILPAIGALAGLICGAAPAMAQVEGAVRLEPVTPWGLEYADDSCRLFRTFGEGDQQVILGISAFEPGGMTFISAVGGLTRLARRVETVKLSLDTVEDYHVRYLQADFDGTPGLLIGNAITFGPLPDGALRDMRQGRPVERLSLPEVEQQVRWIGFIDGLESEFIAATGSMQEPLAALEECTRELVTHWDIDHEAHDTLARVAMPASPPYTWLELRDLPRAMRQDMLIHYRLIVDAAGEVADCHIADTDPKSEFAQAACAALLEKARFRPAQGRDGQPVRSYFTTWANLVD